MNFSNRILVFALGLTVGLLIGAGFFIFKIDDYLSKIEFFKGSPDTVMVVTESKDKNLQNTKNNYTKSFQKNNLQSKSADTTKTSSDSISFLKDSLNKDTVITFVPTNSDEIVVKKDELLLVKSIDVLNFSQENKTEKDSILQKESGIKNDSKNSVAAFKVEFWQSPVNYKGYKMSKNKIVLFGIAQNEQVKIYKVEDSFYMKQLENIYRLDFTNDFRQFESVKDQAVLAKIK